MKEDERKILYHDLRDWLDLVEKMGELRRLDGVSWEDIGLLTDVLRSRDGAPCVLFDKIPGYPEGYRILVNAFGTFRRIALTLGLSHENERSPISLLQEWKGRLSGIKPVQPQLVDHGPIMENVQVGEKVDLFKFPAPVWHEKDGGRYIGTGSATILRDPEGGWINLGTYRVMVHDKSHVGFFISPGKHGRLIRDKYLSAGKPCPVVITCGQSPLLRVAGQMVLPFGSSELDWTGGAQGAPVKVIEGKITGLPIPADAEIALEGACYPGDMRREGPFGEFTGYYASGAREEPVIEVKAVYHRNAPIIKGRPPGKPPFQDARMDSFIKSANIWKALDQAGILGITGVWGHLPGAVQMFIAVSVKQQYAGHSRQAGHVATQCQSGAYLGRYTVVVDDDIDVTDLNEVLWALCTRSDPQRSIDSIPQSWSGPLDPVLPPGSKNSNSRAIIDACKPFEWKDKFPEVCAPSRERFQKAYDKWAPILFETL